MRKPILIGLLALAAGLAASDIRSDEVRGAHFLTQLGSIPYTTAITGVISQDVAAGTALCRDTVTGALGIGLCAVPADVRRLNLADVSGVGLSAVRLSATSDADGEINYGVRIGVSTGNTAAAAAARYAYGLYLELTANSSYDAGWLFGALTEASRTVIDATANAAVWKNVTGHVVTSSAWSGNNANVVGYSAWPLVGGAGSFGTGFDAYLRLRNDDAVAQEGYSFYAYAGEAGPGDVWYGLWALDGSGGVITGGTGYGYRCDMNEGTWTDAWCLYVGSGTLRVHLGSPVGIGPANTAPVVDLSVWDATAMTGVTVSQFRAGDNQGVTPVTAWLSTAGATVAGMSAAGVMDATGFTVGGVATLVTGADTLTTASVIPRVSSAGVLGPSKCTVTTSPVTFQCYDDTAVTGATTLAVRAGAGQATTNLQEWKNAAGANLAYLNADGYFDTSVIRITDTSIAMYGSTLDLASATKIRFSSDATYFGTKTLGIVQTSAGRLQINSGTVGQWGGLDVGSVSMKSLATPGAPTVTPQGVGGATNWGYRIVAYLADGTLGTAAGAEGTTAAGNANLDMSNYNQITWVAVAGATCYRIWRTTAGGAPATTGLITGAACLTAVTFDDTGFAGDGSAAPDQNVTGAISTLLSAQWQGGTEGACNAANRFRVQAVAGGGGVADTFRICSKDAADAYGWRALY